MEMLDHGFSPDLEPEAERQLAAIRPRPPAALRDLTGLLWSSIDNDESRDLDQVEWAERVSGGIRVLVGIADVDYTLDERTPIDLHAAREGNTVYAGVKTFPMLPERLSTNLTSLAEGEVRAAVVIDMTVAPDGSVTASDIYSAMLRNRAQLAYSSVGPWLEGSAKPPAKVAASPDLAAQLRLQDDAACALREARHRMGALSFERAELRPLIDDGKINGLESRTSNRAASLIEDFMIAANETMARRLREAGVSSIRRVVKAPARWPRIVDLAREYGETLPDQPDAAALNAFLRRRKEADPERYSDLSLAVLKLMGSGDYALMRPGDNPEGHFGLAAHDYTHSTAPNRRFADLVTQRLVKAIGGAAPYTDEELESIARNCTLKEDAARRVERAMIKRIAAVALSSRVGEEFMAVVTGVASKGVFVRVMDPPVEGRLTRGEEGVDVGDRFRVRLLSTDPERGFIDFGRV
jgi:exoribonuclease-2